MASCAYALDAVARAAAVCVVAGEAGLGKTRLVGELLARSELRGYRRFLGRCHELAEPFPFGLVVDALLRRHDEYESE